MTYFSLILVLIWTSLTSEALFGQSDVPKISEAYRHYCFDFNWVDKLDRHGNPISDYSSLSAKDHIHQLVEMNANALMVFSMSISGYMFYDSQIGVRHPTLEYDYLKEMIRLGHENGIAMELYLPTMWAHYLIQEHSSWGIRNPDGTLYTRSYGGYHPDPNSPASDWYVEVIRELIPAYKGDALFADGISFLKYGQSEYTIRKFKHDLGRDYPTSLDNDPDWRGTLRWEVEQIEKFWRKLRGAIKERDPSVEVTFNGPGPNIAMPGRSGYRTFVPVPPHVNQLTDYVFTEAGSTGEYATWTRGIAYPKPFKVTFLNRHSILDPFDPDEIRARLGRTLAVGGEPYRYDRTSINGEANRYFTETWSIIFKEVKEKGPYVIGAEPVKYVALVSSEPTMLYRGRSDDSCHANDLVGALKMLDALHIQHDVVADWNLKTDFLKPYRLVILPNVSCMTDAQVAAIREYVRQGGTIIATAEASLFQADGRPRRDFGLGDVLGVRVDEEPNSEIQADDRKLPVYIHAGKTTHPIFQSLPKTELIILGDSVYVKAIGGKPTAQLIEDAATPMHAPARTTQCTAIQVNKFGKGQAIYICGSIFARSKYHAEEGRPAKFSPGVHWVDDLVAAVVKYLAPNPPWSVQTSEKIWVGLNLQTHKRRHILHLVNWQTDLMAHSVEVEIAAGSGVGQKATMIWPKRQPLTAGAKNGVRVYTIPEVGPHVMVVFDEEAQ